MLLSQTLPCLSGINGILCWFGRLDCIIYHPVACYWCFMWVVFPFSHWTVNYMKMEIMSYFTLFLLLCLILPCLIYTPLASTLGIGNLWMLIGFLFHVNSLFFGSERGDQNRLGIYRKNNHESLHLYFLQPLGSKVLTFSSFSSMLGVAWC